MTPIIDALRAWLRTCPLIAEEQDATGAAFRIAGLDEEMTAFSIEDSPTDPIVTEYLSGWDMARNFLFLSRRDYGSPDVLNVQSSGFFEQLADWVQQQNTCRALPDLAACGRMQAQRIAVTSTGFIATSGAGSCKMQMQLRLEYYKPKY